MRFTAVEVLYEAALKDPNIYFITGDIGHANPKAFQERLADQYFNAGMAEQNIVGVAAGLALSGRKVFVYSIVPFITLRCFEQIKVDVCYHNVDVTVIGVGGGFTYGNFGATHYSIEEIAALRALPNMKIICPGTPYETKVLTEEIIREGGPAYMRIGRGKEPNVGHEYPLQIGKAVVIRPGEDATIFVSGTILMEALRAADILKTKGIHVEIINMHTIKPLDEIIVRDRATKRKVLFTLEEHNAIGGLGGAVAEVLSGISGSHASLHRFGVPDKWPEVFGSQQYLRGQVGISGEVIAEDVERIISELKRNELSIARFKSSVSRR